MLGINYRRFLSQHLTFKSTLVFNGPERSGLQYFCRECCEQKMLYYMRGVHQRWKAMAKSSEYMMLMPTRAEVPYLRSTARHLCSSTVQFMVLM